MSVSDGWVRSVVCVYSGTCIVHLRTLRGSLVAQTVRNLLAVRETQVRSLSWEDPLEKGMAVFLPGESHAQRSLAGYSPWGRKESDMAEQLTHTQYA